MYSEPFRLSQDWTESRVRAPWYFARQVVTSIRYCTLTPTGNIIIVTENGSVSLLTPKEFINIPQFCIFNGMTAFISAPFRGFIYASLANKVFCYSFSNKQQLMLNIDTNLTDTVTSLSCSEDQQKILLGYRSGSVSEYSLASNAISWSHHHREMPIIAMGYFDSNKMLTVDAHGVISIYDEHRNLIIMAATFPGSEVFAVVNGEKVVVVKKSSGKIVIFDARTATYRIIAGQFFNSISVVSTATAYGPGVTESFDVAPITYIHLSADGNKLLLVNQRKMFGVVNLNTHTYCWPHSVGSEVEVRAGLLTRDGTIVMAFADGFLRSYNDISSEQSVQFTEIERRPQNLDSERSAAAAPQVASYQPSLPTECPVCLENFSSQRTTIQLACRHCVCNQCRPQLNSRCPICRRPF